MNLWALLLYIVAPAYALIIPKQHIAAVNIIAPSATIGITPSYIYSRITTKRCLSIRNNSNRIRNNKTIGSKTNQRGNNFSLNYSPKPITSSTAKNKPQKKIHPQHKERKLTSIEKANQEYKAKRLRDRLDRHYKLFQSKIKSIISTSSANDKEFISQKLCDETLGICTAANEWDKYNEIVNLMKKYNLMIEISTYRCCLKECFSVGNGQSAMRIFESMKSLSSRGHNSDTTSSDGNTCSIDWEGRDFDNIIGALCKNDSYHDETSWEKILDIIDYASNYYKEKNKRSDIKVETYNHIISCFENNKKWVEAMELLTKMEGTTNTDSLDSESLQRYHPKPNLATYHAVLNTLISSNQLDQAVKLLLNQQQEQQQEQQHLDQPKPSTYTYEIVLSAITKNDHRGSKYKQAIQLIQSMSTQNIPIPIEMYNRVISSCSKAKQTSDAMCIFKQMKQNKIQPDTVTYNSLLSACANTKNKRDLWTKDAFRLFEECKDSKFVQPDVITYTNVIRVCGKSRLSKRALKFLEDAKKESIPLDVFIYTAVIDVCAKDREWRMALDLLNDMKQNNIIPNQHTYSAVINALGNSGQWERALDILDQMKEKGMKVNVVAYNSAISALAKASRGSASSNSSGRHDVKLWEKALGLLHEMKVAKVWPDKYSYSSAITCCASDARYQEALDLIEIMRNGPSKIRPNRISYTGAMTACARAGEWPHALRLFTDMNIDRIGYDVVAYNALVSSFQNGGKPDMAYAVWNEMCGKSESNITGMKINEVNVKPDIITLTNVIASLERAEGNDNLRRMDSVFEDAVERQIILRNDSMDTMWEIDLSGMSLPVARAACRYILNKRLPGTVGEKYEDLMLITGVGKHHQQQAIESRTALREYVRQILREDFDPPLFSTIPSNAAGTVQVNKDIVKTWVSIKKH